MKTSKGRRIGTVEQRVFGEGQLLSEETSREERGAISRNLHLSSLSIRGVEVSRKEISLSVERMLAARG